VQHYGCILGHQAQTRSQKVQDRTRTQKPKAGLLCQKAKESREDPLRCAASRKHKYTVCSHYEAGFENLVPKGTLVERAPNPIMISQQLERRTAGEARCWLWKRAAGAMRAYIYTKSILPGSKGLQCHIGMHGKMHRDEYFPLAVWIELSDLFVYFLMQIFSTNRVILWMIF